MIAIFILVSMVLAIGVIKVSDGDSAAYFTFVVLLCMYVVWGLVCLAELAPSIMLANGIRVI